MSANAHRGDHDIAFYEAALEETRELGVTTAFAQFSDAAGPLTPGRYLIQLAVASSDTAFCWVHLGKFEKGENLGGTAAAGRRRFPLSRSTVVAIESHVLGGYSDRLGAIMSAGSGTLYVSRVSTAIPKGVRSS